MLEKIPPLKPDGVRQPFLAEVEAQSHNTKVKPDFTVALNEINGCYWIMGFNKNTVHT